LEGRREQRTREEFRDELELFLPSFEAQSKSGRPLIQVKVKESPGRSSLLLYRCLRENAEDRDDLRLIEGGVEVLRDACILYGVTMVDVDELMERLKQLEEEGVEVPGEFEVEVTDQATGEVCTITVRAWKREVE